MDKKERIDRAVIELNGEWPDGSEDYHRNDYRGYFLGVNDRLLWRAGDGSTAERICTYPEFMEARKRLFKDKDVDKIDWSKAPEDATHAAFRPSGRLCWYKLSTSSYQYWYEESLYGWQEGVCDSPSRGPLECRPDHIADANKMVEGEPEWVPGKTLPPTGQMVDIDGESLVYGHGESGEVVGHIEKTAIVRMSYGLGCFTAKVLKPAKSHKERVIEAAMKSVYDRCGPKIGDDVDISLLANLYDAGMLTLPEDSQ